MQDGQIRAVNVHVLTDCLNLLQHKSTLSALATSQSRLWQNLK